MFLLFVYPERESQGGAHDFAGVFRTLDGAKLAFKGSPNPFARTDAHIAFLDDNRGTLKVVAVLEGGGWRDA